MSERRRWIAGTTVLAGVLLGLRGSSAAQDSVVDTVHNLSAGGSGQLRSASEGQVCVFCHVPHSSKAEVPLWNRRATFSNYRIYESRTLDATTGQPQGASKLCLSCHDGTIALGSVLSREERIPGATSEPMPGGPSNLGIDLSDDHPISFRYTPGLAVQDGQLRHLGALPEQVRLDADGQVQCTSCHDPHDNSNGDFLVLDNRRGELCVSCHDFDGWVASAHAGPRRGLAGVVGLDWPDASLAGEACASCHKIHGAGGAEWLLRHRAEEDNCLSCHGPGGGGADIASQLNAFSAHDPRRSRGVHRPGEWGGGSADHVECSDCHDPHEVAASHVLDRGSRLGATLRGAPGVDSNGRPVPEASAEYEVCLRCHQEAPSRLGRAPQRVASSGNLRLELAPTAASSHPVVIPSRGAGSVSLVPSRSRGGTIKCTDCHNNDRGPGAGGSGPDGPHGSRFPWLLERGYETRDNSPESAAQYALCYKCHERSSILGDESFAGHRLHVVDQRTPCSACHDPHGVDARTALGGDHTSLIDFDRRIVEPELTTGRLEFEDRGRHAGTCTLNCHGTNHLDRTYR